VKSKVFYDFLSLPVKRCPNFSFFRKSKNEKAPKPFVSQWVLVLVTFLSKEIFLSGIFVQFLQSA
jgi:hypothetical protein